MESTKITNIVIKNFMKLKNVEVAPDSKLNIICGKNRQGKTSLLKAIEFAFKGTSDTSVISTGEDKAEVLIEIGDLSITRGLTAKGTNTVRIKQGEMERVKTKQDFLNSLLSQESFNPFTFILLTGKDRTRYIRDIVRTKATPDTFGDLLNIVGEDFGYMITEAAFNQDGLDVCDSIRKRMYDFRTEMNRLVAEAKRDLEAVNKKIPESYSGCDAYSLVMDSEVETRISALKDAIAQGEANNIARESVSRQIDFLQSCVENSKKELDNINQAEIDSLGAYAELSETIRGQIDTLQKRLRECVELKDGAEKEHEKQQAILKSIRQNETAIEGLNMPEILDIDTLKNKLSEEHLVLKKNDEVKMVSDLFKIREAKNERYESNKDVAGKLTVAIKQLTDEIPARLVAEAHIPIDGLRFEGDNVFIGEVSVENLATSELIEIAVAITREINKNAVLKTLCLDKAEALDTEMLELFAEKIKDDDFQYFLTKVLHDGEIVPDSAMIVENGKIQ